MLEKCLSDGAFPEGITKSGHESFPLCYIYLFRSSDFGTLWTLVGHFSGKREMCILLLQESKLWKSTFHCFIAVSDPLEDLTRYSRHDGVFRFTLLETCVT